MQTPPTYTLLAENGLYGVRLQAGTLTLDADALTADRARAERLLHLLRENTVYAENFYEIMDDLIGTVVW